jgi:hypothetical protein
MRNLPPKGEILPAGPQPPIHVGGFEFAWAGYVQSPRECLEPWRQWTCKQIHCTLTEMSIGSWGCECFGERATGDDGEEAYHWAYEKLNERYHEVFSVLIDMYNADPGVCDGVEEPAQ